MLTVIYIMVSAQVNYKRGRGPQTTLDDILNSALPRRSFHPGSGADVGAGVGTDKGAGLSADVCAGIGMSIG